MIRKLVCLAVLMMLLGLTTNAFATQWAIWTGRVSDDWHDAGNWIDESGNTLTQPPDNTRNQCIGIGDISKWGGTYYCHLRDNPMSGWGPFSVNSGLFAMTEWNGYSQLTFDGGIKYYQANAYTIIGRKTGDTADVIVNSGGIGAYYPEWGANSAAGGEPIWGMTRWLRVGRADNVENGGGLATMVMNGGTVYAQAVTVGNEQGLGDAGSSLTINDGAELYVGVNFYEASFDVGPTASMTINPGGYVKMFGDRLKGDAQEENEFVWAKGALNLVADASASARLIVPAWIETVAQLKGYFGYYEGETLIDGNINAIYNGGAGQFVFSYPGGNFTEITVIPEPATIALLGIGGLCLLRRKRS